MLIRVQEFVYGDITIKNKSFGEMLLADNNGNTITISNGDEIIWANNSINQAWINEGRILKIEEDSDRITVDNPVSISVEGLAYLGIIEKG